VQNRIRMEILGGAKEYVSNGVVQVPCPALLYRARKP
jgi:hypothetical protein